MDNKENVPETLEQVKQKSKMKNYIGVKEISGTEMSLGDYNNYRGWKIPDNEDPKRDGYLVKYEDDYESWSPKEIFEKAYLEPIAFEFPKGSDLSHEQRVINEANELLEKANKLKDFIENNPAFLKLDEKQKDLLMCQSTTMRHYHSILMHRTKSFKLSI